MCQYLVTSLGISIGMELLGHFVVALFDLGFTGVGPHAEELIESGFLGHIAKRGVGGRVGLALDECGRGEQMRCRRGGRWRYGKNDEI